MNMQAEKEVVVNGDLNSHAINLTVIKWEKEGWKFKETQEVPEESGKESGKVKLIFEDLKTTKKTH